MAATSISPIPALPVFLFRSVIFAPNTGGKLPACLKVLGPVAAYVSGTTQMLKNNTRSKHENDLH